jgi:P-type Cu+ transporter
MAAGVQSDANIILLKVDGMMCQNNCGTTVHNALQSIMGVQSVQVSFSTASATVTITDSCSVPRAAMIRDLIDAVMDVGFDACLMEETEPTYVLTISGMMCQKNCGKTVQNALQAVRQDVISCYVP